MTWVNQGGLPGRGGESQVRSLSAFSSHRPHLPLLPPHAAQVPPVPFCFQVTWKPPGRGVPLGQPSGWPAEGPIPRRDPQ